MACRMGADLHEEELADLERGREAVCISHLIEGAGWGKHARKLSAEGAQLMACRRRADLHEKELADLRCGREVVGISHLMEGAGWGKQGGLASPRLRRLQSHPLRPTHGCSLLLMQPTPPPTTCHRCLRL